MPKSTNNNLKRKVKKKEQQPLCTHIEGILLKPKPTFDYTDNCRSFHACNLFISQVNIKSRMPAQHISPSLLF